MCFTGFPAVLSAILITSILGPGMINSMIAIGIFNIPIFAQIDAFDLPLSLGKGLCHFREGHREKRCRDHLEIYSPQHPLHPDRSGDGPVCDCDPGRGRFELSGIGNPTSPCELGQDA